MWAQVGGILLKTVVDHLSNKNSSRAEEPSRSSEGHHNHYQHSAAASQSCQNCNSESRQKGRNNYSNGKYCSIRIPHDGDYEVTVKKNDGKMNADKKKSGIQPKKPNDQQRRSQNSFKETSVQQKNPNNVQKNFSTRAKTEKTRQVEQPNTKKPNKSGNQNGVKLTATNPGSGTTWMYLGRIKKGTQEGDILDFLKELFPNNQFKVEPLPLYKDGKLPSFKVLVENNILSKFEVCWPPGVIVKKYIHNFKN